MTQSFKHSASVQGTVDYENSTKIGLGVSGSYGYEDTSSKTFTVTCTEGSDDLGGCFIEYVDNIVTDKGYYSGKGDGYLFHLFRLTSGTNIKLHSIWKTENEHRFNHEI